MEYQVEWMSRPDEKEHIQRFDDAEVAKSHAKLMSDKHDGSAVVVAIDKRNGHLQAVGHIDYQFGMVVGREGVFKISA